MTPEAKRTLKAIQDVLTQRYGITPTMADFAISQKLTLTGDTDVTMRVGGWRGLADNPEDIAECAKRLRAFVPNFEDLVKNPSTVLALANEHPEIGTLAKRAAPPGLTFEDVVR